jgi:hypothetical protein
VEAGGAGVVAREGEWIKRAGAAALLGALLALAGFVLLQTAIGGDANFEGLREADELSSTIWASGIAAALGYALLAAPLYFLFRAAGARNTSVRGQFGGLAILGPLLLGVSALLIAAGTQQAADTYLGGDAKPSMTQKELAEECREDRGDESQEDCVAKTREEDKASEAIKDSGLVTFGRFIGLAGGLSLLVALFYTGLWAMRTGLLSRFWGSFGMAVGVAALIGITPLALLWFFYLGLVLVGAVPGGRPPAWAAGEAIPWPSPAERAAAELEGPGGAEGMAEESGEPAEPAGDGQEPGQPRRKRKHRD